MVARLLEMPPFPPEQALFMPLTLLFPVPISPGYILSLWIYPLKMEDTLFYLKDPFVFWLELTEEDEPPIAMTEFK